jgi:hypothetical protein
MKTTGTGTSDGMRVITRPGKLEVKLIIITRSSNNVMIIPTAASGTDGADGAGRDGARSRRATLSSDRRC